MRGINVVATCQKLKFCPTDNFNTNMAGAPSLPHFKHFNFALK